MWVGVGVDGGGGWVWLCVGGWGGGWVWLCVGGWVHCHPVALLSVCCWETSPYSGCVHKSGCWWEVITYPYVHSYM